MRGLKPRTSAALGALATGLCLSLAAPAVAAPGATTAAATPSVATTATTPSVALGQRRSPEQRQFIRALRQRVVDIAMSQVGAPYVWGGATPEGFDCSGLVLWTYQHFNITLPHFSGAQMDATTPVDLTKLRRGDLLFYGPDGSQHVSIYIGKGMHVSANNPRVGVVVESMASGYWAERLVGAGRIIR